ncbi:hypothetical protein K503DRAFT_519216 [Rhizopogon vinicolor AM-OR11-026]|uniref:Uncharacterized protein n=1 Tax=Rhizopogon vinicolor AM-OR11-026 TaxID=1314800 RepID=A0A1B7MLK4_9AGAM|nr:hypothetical protein K503DRAFT_519216 [Rhizopogon vinicolor AM-OR11-026]
MARVLSSENEHDRRVALLNGTIAVIDTAKSVVPSALVQSILAIVSNILTITKNTLQNEGDFRGLIEQCRAIRDVVTKATEGQADGDLNSELSDIIISLKHWVLHKNKGII